MADQSDLVFHCFKIVLYEDAGFNMGHADEIVDIYDHGFFHFLIHAFLPISADMVLTVLIIPYPWETSSQGPEGRRFFGNVLGSFFEGIVIWAGWEDFHKRHVQTVDFR